MLTIKNISKVWKQDVWDWRIGKIEELNSAYLFHLYKLNGERLQVNLERKQNIINGEYELWHWKTDKGTTLPERLMVHTDLINTTDKFIHILSLLLIHTK